MHSCDINMLLSKINTFSLNDYVLLFGISNSVFELQYGDGCIYTVCFRNIETIIKLFDLARIEYQEINLEELKTIYNENNKNKFIITFSSEAKNIIDSIKRFGKQNYTKKLIVPSFVYSVFSIDKIEDNNLFISLINYDKIARYNYDFLELDELNKNIKTFPYNKNFYLYKIDNGKKNTAEIRQYAINNLQSFYKEDKSKERYLNLVKHIGLSGYKKLYDIFLQINNFKKYKKII